MKLVVLSRMHAQMMA